MEHRFIDSNLEIEEETQGLIGYAAVFNTKSVVLSTNGKRFIEVIKPGAFARTLIEKDVVAFFNHNKDLILGRKSGGTLSLLEDSYGLRAEILPPNTSAGRDVVENIKRGNVKAMSFGFNAAKDEWSRDTETGLPLRTLIDVDLLEVSPVIFPAYTATEIGLRNIDIPEIPEFEGLQSGIVAAQGRKRRLVLLNLSSI